MQDPLRISLIVTGIGMAALFLALFVLYCLMYLMTALLRDQPPKTTVPTETDESQAGLDTARLTAAAIAVALARAETDLIETLASTPSSKHSHWRALHRQRQLSSRLTKRKRP